jgi:glycerophosphoryl diester phosphodiesterase
MQVFRYNARQRQDRKFNTCGREKNPLQVRFYATNMAYAERYQFVCNDDGEVIYECDLEVSDINTTNLFDMASNYASLATFRNFVTESNAVMLKDYAEYLDAAKTVKERKMWAKQIAELESNDAYYIQQLRQQEFQQLSDFERQCELVAELKAMGFDGYFTDNEVAVF